MQWADQVIRESSGLIHFIVRRPALITSPSAASGTAAPPVQSASLITVVPVAGLRYETGERDCYFSVAAAGRAPAGQNCNQAAIISDPACRRPTPLSSDCSAWLALGCPPGCSSVWRGGESSSRSPLCLLIHFAGTFSILGTMRGILIIPGETRSRSRRSELNRRGNSLDLHPVHPDQCLQPKTDVCVCYITIEGRVVSRPTRSFPRENVSSCHETSENL